MKSIPITLPYLGKDLKKLVLLRSMEILAMKTREKRLLTNIKT